MTKKDIIKGQKENKYGTVIFFNLGNTHLSEACQNFAHFTCRF